MYAWTPDPQVTFGLRRLAEWQHRENRVQTNFIDAPYVKVYKYITGYKGPKPYGISTCRSVEHGKLWTTSFQPIGQKDDRPDPYYGEGSGFFWFPMSSSMDANLPRTLLSKIMIVPEADFPPPDIDSVVDRAVDRIYRPPDLISFVVEGVRELPELFMQGWRRLGFLNLPRRIQTDNVRHNLSSLLSAVRSPRHAADLLSENVLSTQLGLMPTASDIGGIHETLHRGIRQYLAAERSLTQIDSDGHRGLRVVDGNRQRVTRSFNDHLGLGTYTVQGSNLRTYGCYVEAEFPQGAPIFSRSAQAAMGLNWDLATVWNLVPLSFVVDYVVPIGDALRRSRLYFNLRIVPGSEWVSDRFEGEFSGNVGANYLVEPGVSSFPGHHNGIFKTYFRRSYTWDLPDQISVNQPHFPSFRAWSNLFALTHALALRRIAAARGY